MGLGVFVAAGQPGSPGPGLHAVRHPGEGGGVDEVEAGAAARRGIMPAEVAFKAKKIIDRNHDGQGEYGLLSGARGRAAHSSGLPRSASVPADLASGSLDGWHYEVFIPGRPWRRDGGAGGAGSAHGGWRSGAQKSQERHWVAYAWPGRSREGRNRILALLPRTAWCGRRPLPPWRRAGVVGCVRRRELLGGQASLAAAGRSRIAVRRSRAVICARHAASSRGRRALQASGVAGAGTRASR